MRNLLPIVLILISVGLFYFHIDPRYKQVLVLIGEERQYQDALVKAQELGNKRDDLLKKYASFSQDNIKRLSRILPDSVDTVKLVADLDSVASRYGVTIRSIKVTEAFVDNAQTVGGSADSIKPYNTTNIAFHFSSTYPNLVAFLKDLEKSLQMVDIKLVSFDVLTGGTATNLYDYSVSIQTYSLK